MKVTYYGHACMGIETKEKHLLFDPFITGNPLASSIKTDSIKADVLLLSHAHLDHVLDAEAIALRTNPIVVCNFEMYEYYEKKGIKNIHPLNAGGAFTYEGIKIKCVNAIHTSTFEDGTNGGAPVGFVVSSSEGSFYFAGDTALTYDMKLLGEEYNLTFAMLPCGDNFTMGPTDAIKAADFIKCNNIIAMHYNTFDLIKINTDEVTKEFEKAGKRITFLKIGETKEF